MPHGGCALRHHFPSHVLLRPHPQGSCVCRDSSWSRPPRFLARAALPGVPLIPPRPQPVPSLRGGHPRVSPGPPGPRVADPARGPAPLSPRAVRGLPRGRRVCERLSAAMKQRAGRWRGLCLPLPGPWRHGRRRQARSPQTRPEGGRSFPAAQCRGAATLCPVTSRAIRRRACFPQGPLPLALGAMVAIAASGSGMRDPETQDAAGRPAAFRVGPWGSGRPGPRTLGACGILTGLHLRKH